MLCGEGDCMKLKNRIDAAHLLSKLLSKYENSDAIILALPRGGVIVGAEISKTLNIKMDLIITEKIKHPLKTDLTIGAVAESGNPVFSSSDTTDIEYNWLNQQVREARKKINERHQIYNMDSKPLELENKTVILVDDGILTSLSVTASIEEIYRLKAAEIIVVTPTLPFSAAEKITPMVRKLVTLNVEEDPVSDITSYYETFTEVTDEMVVETLDDLSKRELYSK